MNLDRLRKRVRQYIDQVKKYNFYLLSFCVASYASLRANRVSVVTNLHSLAWQSANHKTNMHLSDSHPVHVVVVFTATVSECFVLGRQDSVVVSRWVTLVLFISQAGYSSLPTADMLWGDDHLSSEISNQTSLCGMQRIHRISTG